MRFSMKLPFRQIIMSCCPVVDDVINRNKKYIQERVVTIPWWMKSSTKFKAKPRTRKEHIHTNRKDPHSVSSLSPPGMHRQEAFLRRRPFLEGSLGRWLFRIGELPALDSSRVTWTQSCWREEGTRRPRRPPGPPGRWRRTGVGRCERRCASRAR